MLQAWAIILQLHYIDCSLIAQRACAKHASSETKLQKAKGAKAPTKTLDTELLRYEKARTVFQCTAAAAATSTTVQSSTKVSLSQYMRALTETYLHELFSFPWTFMYIVTMTLWVLFLVLFNSPQLDFFRKNVVFNNTEFLLKALALALALTLVLAARLTMFLMSRKKPFLKSTFSVVEIVKVLAAANSALILGMGLALHYFYTESLLPVFGVSLSVSIYLGICAIPGIFNALPYYSVVTLREVDSTIISNLVKKNN